jgi:hypothetical protein
VYRGHALGAQFAGRYFFADFSLGRVWSMALVVDGAGNASSAQVIEHTAELGGAAALGNVSSFGVDANGELFVLNYSAGRVLSIINPSAPPSAPTNFRIIR